MSSFTKQAIVETFRQLLDERPLDKITVQEIITKCHISRNTFYYHFGDIYALLGTLFQEDVSHLREQHRAGESWEEDLHRIVTYLLNNRQRVKHVYYSLDHGLLEQYLRDTTGDLFAAYVRDEARGMRVPDEDIQAIAHLYQSAFVGAILDWMRRGMKGDPDLYLRCIRRLLQGITRRMLENAVRGSEEAPEG